VLLHRALLLLASAAFAWTPAGQGALVSQSSQAMAMAVALRSHSGAESIDVTGRASSGATVEITAMARLSNDLPVVLLSRTSTVADAYGNFSITVPVAADFWQGTQVTILAEAPGEAPASATIAVTNPASGLPIPATDVDSDP